MVVHFLHMPAYFAYLFLMCVGAWQLRGYEVNTCLKVWVVKKFYLH